MNRNLSFKNWVICCHADRTLTEKEPFSKYNYKIQAGAALTNERVCEYNDYDNFPESISSRNSRYSELTAMFWIYKHIDSDFLGISHYRRRIGISDNELERVLSEGVDIISTIPSIPYENYSIAEMYSMVHYACDWTLFLEIFANIHPEDYELLINLSQKKSFHACNMNIYKAQIYEEYSKWLFPVLEQFYNKSPEKTDIYSKRDVGFIAEFLTSVFVEKISQNGGKVIEKPIIQLKSENKNILGVCDISDENSVYNECNKLYSQGLIRQCVALFEKALEYGSIDFQKEKNRNLYEIFMFQSKERNCIPLVMTDYLPYDYRKNLDVLLNIYGTLKKFIYLYIESPSSELLKKLQFFISYTGFSSIVVVGVLEQLKCDMAKKNELMENLNFNFDDMGKEVYRDIENNSRL